MLAGIRETNSKETTREIYALRDSAIGVLCPAHEQNETSANRTSESGGFNNGRTKFRRNGPRTNGDR